jgi:hypothetical protein
VIDIIVFRYATLAIRCNVICRTTTAVHSKHNNQPKEGHAAKMPVTEAKHQATTSWHDKRTGGQCNTNVSATKVTRMMTTATVTVATMMMMTNMVAAAASIKG